MKPQIIVGVIIGLFVVVILISNEKSASKDHDVTYKVTANYGTSVLSITQVNAQGGTEQFQRKRTPYEASFKMRGGAFVDISAQQVEGEASITCEILIDGKPFKQSTSSGRASIAGCSGSVGEQ